jgi:hypothetical protein
LTPEQAAKLILFVEKYQFKREINDFDELPEGPRKRIKMNEDIEEIEDVLFWG